MDLSKLSKLSEVEDSKQLKATKFLVAMLKMTGTNITATEKYRQLFAEKYNLYPTPDSRDAYTDLVITLENQPKEFRVGLIRALIVRYFSMSDFIEIRDFIQDVQMTLLDAGRKDKELRDTAVKPSIDELIESL